ncbi:hypothetical protein D3C73_850160 [compost metagenome]
MLETRRQYDNLVYVTVYPIADARDNFQELFVGKHPCGLERVRPHILNIVYHGHTPKKTNECSRNTYRQWRMVGINDIRFFRSKKAIQQNTGCKADVVKKSADTTLPMAWVEWYTRHMDAVDDFALQGFDPIARIQFTTGIVWKPCDNLNFKTLCN